MKNSLGRDEIYQLLPGPRAGSSLLSHTENVELLWDGCLSWAAHGERGFSFPGLCQSAGGVSVNQASAVLSSCRCFSRLLHLPPALGAHGHRGGAGPSCLTGVQSFVSFIISSQRACDGGRGGKTVINCLWFHPLHSQEKFRDQC